MKQLSILFIVLPLVQGCKDKEKSTSKKDETIIFRTSERNLIFSLTIDSNFFYYDSLKNKDITLGYQIGSYPKQLNKPSTIHLRIDDKDTSFRFPLYKADSILFGLRENRSFYVITNHDKAGWAID